MKETERCMLELNLVVNDVYDIFAELDNSFRILWKNISSFFGCYSQYSGYRHDTFKCNLCQ